MAEIVVSSVLSVLFDKLASAAWETLAPYFEADYDVEKLKRASLQIRSLLADASEKETTNQYVKRWLNDLRHLAYDAEDILDDVATEAMRRELNDESETHTSKVRKLLPNPFSKHSSGSRMMKDKINDITTKLQGLLQEKDALGLVVKEETKSPNVNRRLQTSIVHESSIFGRRVEKEALVHTLLQDEQGSQNFSIVPIVGMGGVGKTTLARLVYDEKQVTDHFKLKAWVCVSDEFDCFNISKVIFQSVTGENKEFADLNLLQVALRDHLREKRFLLVLDDVWSECCQDWDNLVGPFHACASGSKIVMTTRKDQLLKMLGYVNLKRLPTLSLDAALSLLALHALGVSNFDSHLSLKTHGLGIAKKCDGLPLALKAIGRLLSTKKDEGYWKEVLDSQIWRLPVKGEIVPALMLSYHDLSPRLKQLFAYCSLFPKDCVFDKDEVVRLWMAEGFLQQSTPSYSVEERLGDEYFDELLSRSFFQHAPNNESLFVMHDLMNDLATFVAGGFFLRLGKDIENKRLEKYRHMSLVGSTYIAYKKFKALERAKSLRTLLATSVGVIKKHSFLSNKILVDLLPKLQLLRVLSLSNFRISDVPETIGTLKHLRYLNLSRTKIKHLPESVCNLYNLQTLVLFSCHNLGKLPNNFSKLQNLQHFDVMDTPLLENMPLGIGELKSLQTLSKVIIGVEGGIEITKLNNLKNLCGKISIAGLDKVQDVLHAREANMSQKRFSELEVVWSDVSDGSRNEILEKGVLNELKPSHVYLKQLKVMSYAGLEFPNWIGDPSFLQLMHVSISGCKKCASLPPLGQLQSLKELFIEGLDGLKVVGLEFLGTSGAFPSLEILSFKKMRGWEKWSTYSGVVFPCLKQLHIEDCPNLVEVSLEALPLLNVLEIYKCDSGVLRRLVQVASVVTKLEISDISGLNEVVWRGIIEYLGVIEELHIRQCNEIRYLWESEAVASKVLVKLRNLSVDRCDNLVSLGEKEEGGNCRYNFLTSLRRLDVFCCVKLECCICPDNIEVLRVNVCNSLTSIFLPMREDACISDWPNKKSIIELKYLVHLTELKISHCESLETFPANELPNLTLLTRLEVHHCPSMDVSFSCGNWPPNLRYLIIGKLKKTISEWEPQNFPTSLRYLWLFGDDGVSSSSQFSHLLPSSLTSLVINGFEKLDSALVELQHLRYLCFGRCPNVNELSHPQHLTSLQHLEFYECPNMMDLPEMLLPSLLSLIITDNCPKLKERYSERGNDWPLVSHIPFLDIKG